jgi:hypothetical protein
VTGVVVTCQREAIAHDRGVLARGDEAEGTALNRGETGTMSMRELRAGVERCLPEVNNIKNHELRDKVIDAWAFALSQSEFARIDEIKPSGNPDTPPLEKGTQSEHLRTVAAMEEAGFRILAWWDAAPGHFLNNRRPINTPDDLKGLKMWVMESPVWVKSMTALGANPVALDFKELFSALQQNVIDGYEGIVTDVDKQSMH